MTSTTLEVTPFSPQKKKPLKPKDILLFNDSSEFEHNFDKYVSDFRKHV